MVQQVREFEGGKKPDLDGSLADEDRLEFALEGSRRFRAAGGK